MIGQSFDHDEYQYRFKRQRGVYEPAPEPISAIRGWGYDVLCLIGIVAFVGGAWTIIASFY